MKKSKTKEKNKTNKKSGNAKGVRTMTFELTRHKRDYEDKGSQHDNEDDGW